MILLPKIKRITRSSDLNQFSQTYLQSSGLSIPDTYINNPNNRVYATYYRSKMIGGFILGNGSSLRTLEVFAQPTARQELYDSIGSVSDFTEITCFWIKATHRKNTRLNTFIWLALAFCLYRFGTAKILFGTCSSSLARLYGVTPKSKLIYQGQVNGKRTYIFESKRAESIQGFIEILQFKLKRTFKIRINKYAGFQRQRRLG